MSEKYYFSFAQELKKVEQKKRSPKKVFVLGEYSSAAHARWMSKIFLKFMNWFDLCKINQYEKFNYFTDRNFIVIWLPDAI